MKTFEEVICDTRQMISFWRDCIEKKNSAIAPYEKEYDVVFQKWKRLDDEIQKLHDAGQDSTAYMTAANRLRMKQEASSKIERLGRQAEAFLPEIKRLRSYITPLNNSKEEYLKNLEDAENILENAVEGANWEIEYGKHMGLYYTVGRPTYYN